MQLGPSEDDPEEPLGPGGRREPARAEPPSSGARGWVPPPEARTWRHPSELDAPIVATTVIDARGARRTSAFVVGSGALAAILLGALLLAHTGATPAPAVVDSTPVGTAAVTPCCTLSPLRARDAVQVVVALSPVSARGTTTGCGVVVGDGLVATTVAALGGSRSVRVVEATGQVSRGSVVATDPLSSVVLLRLSGADTLHSTGFVQEDQALESAPVDDPDAVQPGAEELAVAMHAVVGRSAPTARWSSGIVVSVGEPGTAAPDVAGITVRGSSVPVMPGEPLIDRQGRVIGILDGASGSERAFLPMPFVTGVAEELATIGKVRHGWLGVTDSTANGGEGAVVLWVDPHGAAAGSLDPGDVIVRVDGWRVRSSADLRSILYVMPPGVKVAVQAVRGADPVHTVVELAASP